MLSLMSIFDIVTLIKEVPTHVAPHYDMGKVTWPVSMPNNSFDTLPFIQIIYAVQDPYVALNKPTSVDHWLQNAKATGMLADIS
jgi:hypothetical protein